PRLSRSPRGAPKRRLPRRSCSSDGPRCSPARDEGCVTRLLVRAADWCCTFDVHETELAGADVLVDDGAIAAIGVDLDVRGPVDRTVDGRGLVLLPGLVNAHQHLYQGACRAVPQLERALIGPWLAGLG